MSETLIEKFIDKDSIKALETLTESETDTAAASAVQQLAGIFSAEETFKKILSMDSEAETKLVFSFNKNLVLLIQKTWVEKSDEEMKAQILYQLEEFCAQLNSKSYGQAYPQFFSIVDNVVYLMFGNQARAKDFPEYALRIDPEFGIFWWYVKSLPRDAQWSSDRTRNALLLGIYFLANY
ncbi:hypothetical protein [Treponema sp.]|uniref:hypothetical protein n=1 Tax=Treponema sp. TaxID=166 RepID=UPI003F01F9BB